MAGAALGAAGTALALLIAHSAGEEIARIERMKAVWAVEDAREEEAQRFLESEPRVEGTPPQMTVRVNRASRERNLRLLIEALDTAEPECWSEGYARAGLAGGERGAMGEFKTVEVKCVGERR